MAEWHLPFNPPQRQAEEAVAREPVPAREWDPNRFLVCTHCADPIEHGEQCMEFTPGVSGFGVRSGRPMIVDTESPEYEKASLHIGCIYDYVFNLEESISYQNEDEEVTHCGLCGEGTLGASPSYCSNCGSKFR